MNKRCSIPLVLFSTKQHIEFYMSNAKFVHFKLVLLKSNVNQNVCKKKYLPGVKGAKRKIHTNDHCSASLVNSHDAEQ